MSTILIVEDSITEMQVIASCLKRGGLNVETAVAEKRLWQKLVAKNQMRLF